MRDDGSGIHQRCSIRRVVMYGHNAELMAAAAGAWVSCYYSNMAPLKPDIIGCYECGVSHSGRGVLLFSSFLSLRILSGSTSHLALIKGRSPLVVFFRLIVQTILRRAAEERRQKQQGLCPYLSILLLLGI